MAVEGSMSGKEKEKSEALDKLISDTIDCAGEIDPDKLPHRVKDRARRQAKGEVDAESYAKETAKKKK
ncbi:MAG: hypothetical protein R3C60_05555 [Parvularculaceae bacterium]